jgi:hypothetical protein
MSVEIGTAIVSYIEPHAGQEAAFNRWYELDHFPATVKAGPGVFAAARFVATGACKAVRPRTGRLFGDPARGSYLGIAWVLPGHQAEWDEWVGDEMKTIATQGRLFAGRDHVHTAIYEWIWESDHAAAITALDRAYPGVVVAADERAAPSLDLPVTIGLRLARTVISQVDPPAHELTIGMCDGDPLAAFGAVAPDVAGCGFAGPFLATIPGTDTYADDL